MNIIFKTTAGEKHGFGHLTRSINLAGELRRGGNDVKFQIINPTREAIDLLKYFPIIECYEFPKETDVYILDLPPYDNFQEGIINWMRRKTGKPIILITDMGLLSSMKTDLIIDTLQVESIILHPYYAGYHKLEKTINEKIKRVHLALGGYVEEEKFEYFSNIIKGIIPGVEISHQAGFSQENIEPDALIAKNNYESAKLMHEADLTICSPGITAAEAACCGTPAIYISRNADQWVSSGLWEKKGCGLKFAYNLWITPEHILTCLQILSDIDFRNILSRNGKNIVDGQGIYRAIKKIREVVNVKA